MKKKLKDLFVVIISVLFWGYNIGAIYSKAGITPERTIPYNYWDLTLVLFTLLLTGYITHSGIDSFKKLIKDDE